MAAGLGPGSGAGAAHGDCPVLPRPRALPGAPGPSEKRPPHKPVRPFRQTPPAPPSAWALPAHSRHASWRPAPSGYTWAGPRLSSPSHASSPHPAPPIGRRRRARPAPPAVPRRPLAGGRWRGCVAPWRRRRRGQRRARGRHERGAAAARARPRRGAGPPGQGTEETPPGGWRGAAATGGTGGNRAALGLCAAGSRRPAVRPLCRSRAALRGFLGGGSAPSSVHSPPAAPAEQQSPPRIRREGARRAGRELRLWDGSGGGMNLPSGDKGFCAS